MKPVIVGYEVVCPDGHVRHYPYTNEGDADCDAEIFSKKCQSYEEKNDLEKKFPPCQGGEHVVKIKAFIPPRSKIGEA